MVTFSGVDLPSQQIRNRNVQRRKRLKNKKEPKKKKKNADWMKKFVDCSCVLIDTKDFEMLFELLQLYTEYVVLKFYMSVLRSNLRVSSSNIVLFC